MRQIGRTLTAADDGTLLRHRVLIHVRGVSPGSASEARGRLTTMSGSRNTKPRMALSAGTRLGPTRFCARSARAALAKSIALATPNWQVRATFRDRSLACWITLNRHANRRASSDFVIVSLLQDAGVERRPESVTAV